MTARLLDETGPPRPVGGFLELEPLSGPHPAAAMEAGRRLDFWNARAALAHLLSARHVPRVWLPAYICRAAADAASRDGRDICFYATGAGLKPDGEDLVQSLRPGDAVLGVDYFGARRGGLPELPARFPDVLWIQDRAQALWPDPAPWGDYVLYSPRKVVGAPDGGVLIWRRDAIPPPAWSADDDLSRLEPTRLRAEDPEGAENHVWFAAYQRAEAAMTCEPRPMSDVSRSVLQALDMETIAARRRRNAARLLERVGEFALFAASDLLAGTPFGVPVLTDDAGAVAARMAGRRVFCARHWAELPSPTVDFASEHELSRRLLTLPCDHRYGDVEMDHVAQTFLACR
jgi:hypothetical protein